MKTISKQIIVFFSSVIFVFFVLNLVYSSSVSANNNPFIDKSFSRVSYTYKDTVTGSNLTRYFEYSDGLFSLKSNELHGDIAKMCVGLSSAAYNLTNVKSVLGSNQMGFTCVNTTKYENLYNYVHTMTLGKDDIDYVAYSVWHKNIGNKDVYIVPIMGTAKDAQWYSNFNLGTGDDHLGFYKAANHIITDISEILNKNGNLENSVFLFTGHSRGAAVSNIVAAAVTSLLSEENVYSYNFATPAVSKNADTSLKNIYNFNNPGDLIPLLPLEQEGWGFKRNGITIDTFSTSAYEDNTYFQFEQITNHKCESAHNSKAYLETINSTIKSQRDFNSDKMQFIFRVVSYTLGDGLSRHEWSAVAGIDGYNGAISVINEVPTDAGDLVNRILNSSFGFYYKAVEFIESNEEQVSSMSDKQFASFKAANSSMISKIEKYVGYLINSPSEFLNSKQIIIDLEEYTNEFVNESSKIINLFLANGSNPATAITHAHDQAYYISWINSIFFGDHGWENNTSDLSMGSEYIQSITTIGDHCFSGCTNLKNIVLIDDIVKIGDYAFNNCSKAKGYLVFPANLLIIGEGAFSGCSEISGELIIPDGVTKINANTFKGCSSLTKVTIPESVTSISYNAFRNCTGITELTIPGSIKYVGTVSDKNYAFIGCTSINKINIIGNGEICDMSSNSVAPWRISEAEALVVDISEGITKIGNNAFENTKNLVSVNLPSTIKIIGGSAFSGCSSLEFLTLSKNTFNKTSSLVTRKLNLAYEENNVNLPEGMTSIGASAFCNCTNLKGEIIIPDGVTSIENATFNGCTGISKVTIPESVKSIGGSAFHGCSGITELTVPCGIKYGRPSSDWYFAFEGCTSINTINIIGEGEMPNYSEYNSDYNGKATVRPPWYLSSADTLQINISDGVTKIGSMSFWECENLTNITIPNSVSSIGYDAFYNCAKLQSLTLPNNMESIGSRAFCGCCSIDGELNIPYGIKKINDDTFANCSKISKVYIPDSVTEIGNGAFKYCTKLNELTVPCVVKYRRSGSSYYFAFEGCKAINVINIIGNGEMPDYSAYEAETTGTATVRPPWYISTAESIKINISEGVTKIGDMSFWESKNITEVSIPSTVTSIGSKAFNKCSKLQSLSLPDKLTTIGSYAFSGCSAAKGEFKLPMGLTSIGTYAFNGCSGLTGDVTFPNGITKIDDHSFAGCTGISKVYIPDNVTKIGNGAFLNCRGITELTVPCKISYNRSGSSYYFAFGGCTAISVVNIIGNGEMPDYSTYEAETTGAALICPPWYISTAEKLQINISEGVTKIGDMSFWESKNITGVSIPSTVTSIGSKAFNNCEKLQNLSLPDGLTTIGSYAFSGCSAAKGEFKLPTGLTSIGTYAFNGCSGLTGDVTIPQGITKINDHSFAGCTGISKLYIPDTVTKIGNGAFLYCRGITELTVPCKISYNRSGSSYYFAFGGCTAISVVNIIGNGEMPDYSVYDSESSGYATIRPPWYISSAKSIKINIVEGVTKIGSMSFWECKNLTEVSIPSTVTLIGSKAFYNCTNLKKLTLPETLNTLGTYAFYGCSELAGDLRIPNGIKSINSYTFYGCTGINHVYIPESVTSIANYAFNGCAGITDVFFDGTRSEWNKIKIASYNSPITKAVKHFAYYDVALSNIANGSAELSIYRGKGGEEVTVTVNPDLGYELDAIIVNGTTIFDMKFTMPEEDVTVVIRFKKIEYKVTVNDSEHGTATVSLDKATIGDEITVTVTPDDGYQLDTIKVNGENISDIKFLMPASDVTVDVTFKLIEYSVTVNEPENGTVTVSKELANVNDEITITALPNGGYVLDVIKVNGNVITGNTFTMPAENVTVEVSFKKIEYSIVVNETTNGTASASKDKATCDDEIEVTATPAEGYELDEIKVNGKAITSTKFVMPCENVTIDVSFKKIEYAITVNKTSNGTASVSKDKAPAGDIITITATPDACYALDSIKVNGEVIEGNNFTMPPKKVTIEVAFKAKPHQLTKNEGKAATCTEAGYEAYYKCSECNKLFSDAEGKKEIPAPIVIKALGHHLVHIKAKDPTKTEAGNIEYYKCDREGCGKLFKDANGTQEISDPNDVIIPAIGHDLELVPKKDPTCTEPGNIAYYKCKDPDCDKLFSDKFGREQIALKDTVIPATGHKIEEVHEKAATCTVDGYEAHFKCTNCNKLFSDKDGKNEITSPVVIPKLGHEWDDGEVTNKASCETTGIMTFHCKRDGCKETKEETIPALGHDIEHLEHHEAKASTRDNDGNIEYWICTRCGKYFTDADCKHEIDPVKVIIPAIGAAELGEEAKVDGLRYVVTNPSTDDSGTVTLIGKIDPISAVSVPATIVYRETSYQVTKIASKAFYKDLTIKTLVIGPNVKSIDSNAFYGCKNLTKVSGGSKLETIGTSAFAYCSKLKSFTITSPVLKKIGATTFNKDKKLKTVFIRNTFKLTKSGVKKSLKGSSVKTVKVKKSKVKKYKKFFTKKNCGRKVKVKK